MVNLNAASTVLILSFLAFLSYKEYNQVESLKGQLKLLQLQRDELLSNSVCASSHNVASSATDGEGTADRQTGEEDIESILHSSLNQVMIVFSFVALGVISSTASYFRSIRSQMAGFKEKGFDVTFTDLALYHLDYWLSTSSSSKVTALLIATGILVLAGALLVSVVFEEVDFFGSLWVSWTYVIDSGAHTEVEAMSSRAVALLVTIGGMLVFALMIGLISDGIGDKVDSLKKGKSRVIEVDHTLILGWNDKIFTIIRELSLANESNGGGVIVILAEKEKEDMENAISDAEIETKGTAVICRSGSPMSAADLKKVAAEKARHSSAAIDNLENADSSSVRVVLSLVGLGSMNGHVVVEMQDIDNRELVTLCAGNKINVQTVVAHDMIGRLMVQCSRQRGLAQVMESLLGFEGCEFYFSEWEEITGKSFGDVHYLFEDAVCIGVEIDCGDDKSMTRLNPSDDYIMQPGDKIIVIAEDDDTYKPSRDRPEGFMPRDRPNHVVSHDDVRQPESILFCGWRRDMDDMIMVLDEYVVPGSTLTILSVKSIEERSAALEAGGLTISNLKNLTLIHVIGCHVLRRHLELLPLDEYETIVILADESHEDNMQATDSTSLASLLLIRDVRDRFHKERFKRNKIKGIPNDSQGASSACPIISEILDSTTKSLIQNAEVSDFVMSNELIAMSLAMVSENAGVNKVLDELLTSEGNETYVRDANKYFDDGETICFMDIQYRARKRTEVAIGYIDVEGAVQLNPPKKYVYRKWSHTEKVIVLSENETN